MILLPPRSTHTHTHFPYTTLFRSPMMMTAAGTVSAAKAFVMGVGVAGLQAIATARRLGAQVSATDVRAATKEQIMSLGAKPIRSDEHTSELQSLMRNTYAVFSLKKKNNEQTISTQDQNTKAE